MAVAEVQELAINGTVLVIGEIRFVTLPAGVMADDGYVDIEAAGTVALSGLDSYHRTQREGRWQYAKPDKAPATF